MMSSNGVQETGMRRSSTGLSNGLSPDFEILSHPPSSTGSQPPVSLSQINPLGMSQTPSSLTDVTLEQALMRVHDLSRENSDLRDYLKDNNEMMKKQYEALAEWKKKVHDANVANRDKFDQTKALILGLILGLRKDNEELLEKVRELETSKEEKMTELLGKIHALESARLKSEQLATQVCSKAEEQGMSMDDLDLTLNETVVVSVSAETEERISQLENELEEKNGEMKRLTEEKNKLSSQVGQFRDSADQLLKDLECQQKLKEDLQRENQELLEKNLDLNLQLQSLLSDTRISLQLVEKAGFSSKSQSGMSDVVGMSVTETQEVARLLEQLQKNEQKFKTEMATMRSHVQGEKNKSQQLQARLTENSQRISAMIQQHEQEVAVLRKEHEQKLMELARQQDTEREQQLQSATYDTDVQSLRSQVLTLISEVHETQTKLSAATDAHENKDRRMKDLEERNKRYQMDLNQNRHEMQALIHSLQQRCGLSEHAHAQERQSHEVTKHNMSELRTSFEQLVNDYKELLDTFDQYKLQQERQTPGSIPQNQRAMLEQINHLTAQVMAAEEAITIRDEQIQSLKTDLASKKREYEDMAAVFKAQADVYKADFDAERSAREQQVSDKERILTEMGDLQVQNQQLIDDLEAYSRRQMSEMQRRVAPSPHSYLQCVSPGGPYGPLQPTFNYQGGMPDNQPLPDLSYPDTVNLNQQPNQGPPQMDPGQIEEEEAPLVCPQCNLTCPDMDTLQIHVIECLDQDDQRRANRQ
ncbi:NF-kappa-B essential modulator-like [Haliotis rubra]|uniref:NF-kappa-B essential modulator-like n=1 Tax=Haliotis rubra TaxID=36100 RepID=UPI001EE4F996|nr:NF-kappa-B essential modulator-like [Haliotis rubra]